MIVVWLCMYMYDDYGIINDDWDMIIELKWYDFVLIMVWMS